MTNAGTELGAIPEKLSVNERASVTAGLGRQTSSLPETFCAVLQHLHLLQRDEAACHHRIQHRQEVVDLRLGVHNLYDNEVEVSWRCEDGWNGRTRLHREERLRLQDAYCGPSIRWPLK